MELTFLEKIIAILTSLIFLAGATERGVELFRPLFLLIKNVAAQNAVKIGTAILVGFGLAALLNINVLSIQDLYPAPAVAGYFVGGILASAGAAPWHSLLEYLKSVNNAKRADVALLSADYDIVDTTRE